VEKEQSVVSEISESRQAAESIEANKKLVLEKIDRLAKKLGDTQPITLRSH
jgi:hypothetical protein